MNLIFYFFYLTEVIFNYYAISDGQGKATQSFITGDVHGSSSLRELTYERLLDTVDPCWCEMDTVAGSRL